MTSINVNPVFILSCERSGSTMLRYIVDTHSEVACPGHLYLGNLCEDLNRTLTATLAQNLFDADEQAKKQWVVNETRAIVGGILSRYTEAKNKRIWCEKTPMNLDYLPLLDSHFPEAKYICLYRHGMDVVHSSINLSKYRFLPEHVPYVHKNPGNIIAAMLENWLDKTERLLAFESTHSSRCYRVTYESLVMQPETALPPLFRFIGADWEQDLLERVFAVRHDQGEGDGRAALSSRIRQDSVGKGIEVPRDTIPEKFFPRLGALLAALAYESLDHYYAPKPSFQSREQAGNNASDPVADIFERRFGDAIANHSGRYPSLKGIWKIIVRDRRDRSWIIDFENRPVSIRQGDADVDFSLCLSASLLLDLVHGVRDAVEAYALGEIEVCGLDNNEALSDLARLLFS